MKAAASMARERSVSARPRARRRTGALAEAPRRRRPHSGEATLIPGACGYGLASSASQRSPCGTKDSKSRSKETSVAPREIAIAAR